MIIDSHLHWFPGNLDYLPGRDCPEHLVNSGVLDGAWMLSENVSIYGEATDEQIIELCAKYPDFFVAFGYLDFDEAPPARIDYLYEQGCIGLKAIWPGKPYDDPAHFPYYEKAEKLGMPCYFHVGGSPYWGPEKTRIDAATRQLSKHMMPITLDAVAKTFPNLPIIIAHMGGGPHGYDLAIYIAWGHGNVYLDLSTAQGDLDKVREALRKVGAKKILFGSDGPHRDSIVRARFWEGFFKYVVGDEEACRLIMGENAARIIAEAKAKRKDQGEKK